MKKDPTRAWTDLYDFAAKIRAGSLDYSEIEDFDVNSRLKWTGMLSRFKRTPGRFMMRLRTPNGVVKSDTLRLFADTIEPYGDDLGVMDITTRQNVQLRGLTLEDGADLTKKLHADHNMTSFQSALDNARNVVGSPLAGLDDKELVDTRPITNAINDLISLDKETGERGNPQWGNLPRKFNIAVSGGRDDFAHTYINDIGLDPVPHKDGRIGFNVVVGGYMSIKRVAESVPIGLWVPADPYSVTALCEAILRIFRDEGNRKDRQKARLMWLVEDMGVKEYAAAVKAEVESYDRGVTLEKAQPHERGRWERRELLGVHAQADDTLRRVGVHVPAGRLSVEEVRHVADLADRYSEGEVRLTVEQNFILPNVDASKIDALLQEPALTMGRLSVDPGNVKGPMVSCTGSQFCPLAIIETKSLAERVMAKVDALVEAPRPVRVHWTGCPNSCGQVQAADIGLMGAPAKRANAEGKMKAVAGANIFLGGTIGEGGHLAMDPHMKNVPIDDEDEIAGVIADLMRKHFRAKKRKAPKKEMAMSR